MFHAPLAITLIVVVSQPLSATGSAIAKTLKADYVIAQQYGDKDPHGADPHGADPHDEVHDADLPANKAEDARTAPTDVYGGAAGHNTQEPVHGP